MSGLPKTTPPCVPLLRNQIYYHYSPPHPGSSLRPSSSSLFFTFQPLKPTNTPRCTPLFVSYTQTPNLGMTTPGVAPGQPLPSLSSPPPHHHFLHLSHSWGWFLWVFGPWTSKTWAMICCNSFLQRFPPLLYKITRPGQSQPHQLRSSPPPSCDSIGVRRTQ